MSKLIDRYNSIANNPNLQNRMQVGNLLYCLQQDAKKGRLKDCPNKALLEKIQLRLVAFMNEKNPRRLPALSTPSIAASSSPKMEFARTSPSSTFTFKELANIPFQLVPTGKFKGLLGDLSRPFYVMVYGAPGSGKTTFSLDLISHFYAQKYKVLFVTQEEGKTASFQNKILRLGLQHLHLPCTHSLPHNLASYDIVFIDSVGSLRISKEAFQQMIEQGKKNNTSFVFIFHSTKAGSYKGTTEYEHLVDASFLVKDGEVHPRKNRFGGHETYPVRFTSST